MLIDIVLPNNNESKLIVMAKKLGYDGLCMIYKTPRAVTSDKFLQFSGVLADVKTTKRFKKSDLVAVKTTDARQVVEKARPDLVYGVELHKKTDFLHQRNSGLNQIICRFASEHDVAVGFAFSGLMGARKDRILGRMRQNIRLCRKYKIPMVIASFAGTPFQMRAPQDLLSLFISLGMHPKEASDSLMRPHEIILRNQKKKSPKYISPGVELV